VEMELNAAGDLWPKPFTSAKGIAFETIWRAGDKQFPVAKMSEELAKCIGWYVPICARVPDADVARVAALPDLPGVLFTLQATVPGAASPPTRSHYFHPRSGWDGHFLGPLNFMDCAAGPEVFGKLNAAYADFRREQPDLCLLFDHRVCKTIFTGEQHKVKLHRNMEMVTLSAVPNSNDVTLAPAGGYQCHATLCGAGSNEIAKFCLSEAGLIYPIPSNPFAKSAGGEMFWAKHFAADQKLPTMFYAFAHVGEQTSYSMSHEQVHPEAFKFYKMLNAADTVLEEAPRKKRRSE
jgi:hypothetical protein